MATNIVLNIKVNDDELQELETGLRELGADFDIVEKGTKKVGKGVKDIGKSSYIFQELNKLTGGLAGNVVDVYNGLIKVVGGLNLTKAALISTGIGAFVVILGTMVAYWDEIVESITGVNEELEKQKQLTNEINLALERRNQLEKDNARFIDVQTKEKLLRAKIAGASQDELTQIEREGLEERLRIAEEAAKQADIILQRSVGADEDAYLAAQKEQLKAYDDLAKARGALSIFDLESQLPGNEKAAKRDKESKVNPLTGEDVDTERERISEYFNELFELDKANKEALQAYTEESNRRLLNSDLVAQAKRTENERVNAEARAIIAEEEFRAKMILQDGIAASLQSLGDIVGQETAAGKAFAVAGALINTYASIAGQLKAFAGVPIPGFAIAQAAATALTGFAAVKQIVSVKVPGQGGSSAPGGAIASTPPAFNVVQGAVDNQIATSLLGRSDEPVQAFVVDKEVTTAQELRRNKVNSSSL